MSPKIKRRAFISLLGGAVVTWSVSGSAETPARIPRVGILSPAESDATPIFQAFRRGLRERGYIEGQNIVLEFRLARGDYSAIPRLAAELVNIPVDVIVTDGGPGPMRSAKEASNQIPIVMGAGPDPVGFGLAQSIARPGGTVTGFTLMQSDLTIKRMDVLRTAFPAATAVTILLNPSNEGADANFRAAEHAGRSLGLSVINRLEAAHAEKISAIGGSLPPNAPVVVLPDAMFWNHRREILMLLAAARLPAVYPEREYADDGGLIAYGPNVPDNFCGAAAYVDQILKGAKAGDLPIQEPAKFDFVVNLKTAKTLGITIPPAILVRADEVIE